MVNGYTKAELMNCVCVCVCERERTRGIFFSKVMKPKGSRLLTESSSSTGGSSLNKIESTVARS